jgi:hypothetical protein
MEGTGIRDGNSVRYFVADTDTTRSNVIVTQPADNRITRFAIMGLMPG